MIIATKVIDNDCICSLCGIDAMSSGRTIILNDNGECFICVQAERDELARTLKMISDYKYIDNASNKGWAMINAAQKGLERWKKMKASNKKKS